MKRFIGPTETDVWGTVLLGIFTNSSNQFWVGFLLKGRGLF